MNTVTFYKKADRLIGFSSTGHAGYDEEGSDIVCAAISAVTIMTANAAEGVLNYPDEAVADEENNRISLIWEDGGDKWEVLLKSLQLFLESFQKQVPEYLRIEITEV